MIQLNEKGEFKQVRFSPRLDFVPLMDKEKLELYYSARKKYLKFTILINIELSLN